MKSILKDITLVFILLLVASCSNPTESSIKGNSKVITITLDYREMPKKNEQYQYSDYALISCETFYKKIPYKKKEKVNIKTGDILSASFIRYYYSLDLKELIDSSNFIVYLRAKEEENESVFNISTSNTRCILYNTK